MALPPYKSLPTSEPDDSGIPDLQHSTCSRRKYPLSILLLLSVLVNVSLAYVVLVSKSQEHCLTQPNRLSPALEAVRPKQIKFTRGLEDDVPIYEQSPSPEVDLAWKKLYEYSIVLLTPEEVSLLPNDTQSLPDSPQEAAIGIDVFHQLHCLNTLRKLSLPDYYPDVDPSDKHIRHCVGVIRQALMCFSDITPVVWQFNPELGKVEQRDDVVHSCVDFDSIRSWSASRRYGDGLRLPNYPHYAHN